MTRIVHDVEQRSPEWFALRLGRVTSSLASEMLANPRKGSPESVQRRNLKVRLMLERVTGRSMERTAQTQAMVDGIEREADALAAYEEATGRLLRSVGFVSVAEVMAGASPDGIIGEWEGGIEVKCPIESTHWDYLRSDDVPLDYLRQIRHQQWVTGVRWVDFVSYCPAFPEALRLRIIRVPREENVIAEHERQVEIFLREVEQEEQALRTMANTAAQLRQIVGAA